MQIKRYIVPTHLKREDQILSLWFVSLSARQLLLLIVMGALTYNGIKQLAWLDRTLLGMGIHYLFLGLVMALGFPLIFGKAQGRPFDLWLLILAQYWVTPRRFIWQSFRSGEGEGVPPTSSSLLDIFPDGGANTEEE